MLSDDIVIDVQNLSKCYEMYATPRDRLKQLMLPQLQHDINGVTTKLGLTERHELPRYYREFWALHDISFQVRAGETLGIIGRNGSGKSTLLQILAGTLAPTTGDARITGRIAALLELGSGFNPEFSGRENVFFNGRILGLDRKQIEARYDKIVEFADIGEFIEEPVKTYSSGMYLRLAFAVQAHIDASIVIIDEALAVGDIFFRQKCYARLDQLKEAGAAILLVSHSMPDIEQHCERAILLDHGVAKFIGSSAEASKHYYLLHQAKTTKPTQPPPAEPESKTGKASSTKFGRPPAEAFLNLIDKSQVSNGQGRFIGIALCNEEGEACVSFRQGERAVFYYEFEVGDDVEVPFCGVVIKNERNIIVHGKNAWQYDDTQQNDIDLKGTVLCKQEIVLNLAPGEYVFEVGLAATSRKSWENRRSISHEESVSTHTVISVVTDAGNFTIGWALHDGIARLTHHGIADLPGKFSMAALK
jgi:homopolymeric O-antigen transport system ATP-binding protein